MPELLRNVIARVAARGGDRPAISLPGQTLSYAEVGEVADRAANLLLTLGHGEGDVVMACCGNSPAMLATWLGCIRVGAVFMPVNALLTGNVLRNVMEHAAGRLVVVDAALLKQVLEIRDNLTALPEVLVAGGPAPAGTQSFDRLLEAAPATPAPQPRSTGTAAARLMYTSGTTGSPKGVIWSRIAEAYHAQCYGDELVRVATGENVYSCLPLFHATCQGTVLGTLWRGGHVHVDAGFEPFRFWSRVRETQAVFFPYVGTILSTLARRPARPDDADNPVQRAMGSAAPAGRWREIEDRFGLRLEDVWGQTETASCWTRPSPGAARPGTVGHAVDRFEARVVGGDGEPTASGEIGELWIRPRVPHVMFEGYLNDPLGSAAMWTADGWYRSGDRMRQLAEGDLVFEGRSRDAIRRRGEMISPAPIEQAALECADVLEAAAVGIDDSDGVEEEIKLCVVPRAGSHIDPVALHTSLRGALPAFMVPRYIAVYAAFAKTPTTRIQKYRLQATGTTDAWDARRAATGPSDPLHRQ